MPAKKKGEHAKLTGLSGPIWCLNSWCNIPLFWSVLGDSGDSSSRTWEQEANRKDPWKFRRSSFPSMSLPGAGPTLPEVGENTRRVHGRCHFVLILNTESYSMHNDNVIKKTNKHLFSKLMSILFDIHFFKLLQPVPKRCAFCVSALSLCFMGSMVNIKQTSLSNIAK